MTKPKIPSLMSNRDYATAAELVQSLKSKLLDLDAEESRLHDKASVALSAEPRNAAVAKLLGDDAPDAHDGGIHARLTAISVERRDLRSALQIATQRLGTARMTASAPIVAEIGPEYRRRVKAVAHALIVAYKANVELGEMVDSMNMAGLAWSELKPMNGGGVFGPATKFGAFLQECAREQFIQSSEIPEGLR